MLRPGELTIADDLVARLALDVAAAYQTEASTLTGRRGAIDLRCKANTTGIFLELGIIESLLDRECTSP